MITVETASIGGISIGQGFPLALIAGPCVIESRDHTLRMADGLARIARRLEIPLIFKASFDKANRSSVDSFRGPGMSSGLAVLGEVRREMDVPVLTDVHLPEHADEVARSSRPGGPDGASTSRRASLCPRRRWATWSRRSPRRATVTCC